MNIKLKEKLIDRARENGIKYGKKAELDFGAGAEWMYEQLKDLLKQAYVFGRDNGSNKSENNFNDFLQTEAVQKALNIHGVVVQSEQLCECDTPLIRTNIKGGEYCALCGKELC